MNKIWLKSYPARVPPEIDPNEFASINDILQRTFRRFTQHAAYRNLGTTLTYAQIERLSRDFAAWLQGVPGLQKGSRIALMMPNRSEEHTSELQSLRHLVCRLLLGK